MAAEGRFLSACELLQPLCAELGLLSAPLGESCPAERSHAGIRPAAGRAIGHVRVEDRIKRGMPHKK